MAFRSSVRGRITFWRGDSNDDDAHAWLKEWLANGLRLAFRPTGSPPLSNRVRGNLGESIVFRVGSIYVYPGTRAFVANAIDPLQDISRPGLDVTWVRIAEQSDQDLLIIHEVKTTGEPDLSITGALKDDIKKLFGTDPRLTLPARVDLIANDYEFLQDDLAAADRVRGMSAHSPQTADQVLLSPTLVHDAESSDPEQKLTALLVEIEGLGWNGQRVSAWSVAMGSLNDRLQRLSEGA